MGFLRKGKQLGAYARVIHLNDLKESTEKKFLYSIVSGVKYPTASSQSCMDVVQTCLRWRRQIHAEPRSLLEVIRTRP